MLIEITFTLVFTATIQGHCAADRACANLETSTIYMHERAHLTGTRTFDLNADVFFPHYGSTNHSAWVRCGEAIGDAIDVPVTYNDARTLCHEVKHLVTKSGSHNQ